MKASVIVVAWNGARDLADCLDAVQAQAFPDVEIIVVDNGSTDGSADLVADRYPGVRLIRNARNLGFATGNNLGLRQAGGDVLVLLNQDTVVRPGWLQALVDTVTTYPACGIAGGKALYPDGRIQHAGGFVDERGGGSHYGYRQKDEGQFEQTREVDFCTGASLAISRAAYEAVGDLDEGFGPAYYEDVDWCYRAREAGFRVVYTPSAVLIHAEASRAASLDHQGMYLLHHNRLRFVLKHWPPSRWRDEFVPAEQAWLESLGQGGEQLVAALQHTYLHHLLHLDEIVQWRTSGRGKPADEADVLAQGLLTLRTALPMGPVHTLPDGKTAIESATPALTNVLHELRQRETLAVQEPRPEIPVLGALANAVRGLWNCTFARPNARLMLQQQVAVNIRIVAILEQMISLAQAQQDEKSRLQAVLIEYLREHAREIGEIAQEVDRLNGPPDKNAQDASGV